MAEPAESSPAFDAYSMHELQQGWLRLGHQVVSATAGWQNAWITTAEAMGFLSSEYADYYRHVIDSVELVSERISRDFPKPEFGIDSVAINGEDVAVHEETVEGIGGSFGALRCFVRENTQREEISKRPSVLIVAPMSGHYATLLRETVRTMLTDHDVYITDWANARDVPLSAGEFGLDEYVDYAVDYIRAMGPDANVVAVCQSTVPVLAAVAHIAEVDPDLQPATLTLMAGPLDTKMAPTVVTQLAEEQSLDWFANTMVSKVPAGYAGAGRDVYPGFMQLFSFMAMNPGRHQKAFTKLVRDIFDGNKADAERVMDFYNEYRAVCDLDAKFYLDTVYRIFQQRELARGVFRYKGRNLNMQHVTRTRIFTVEGENDDISAVGQTEAAHAWLSNVPPAKHAHYVAPRVGHYGTFSGKTWARDIAPRITWLIRDEAVKRGLVSNTVIDPDGLRLAERWQPILKSE